MRYIPTAVTRLAARSILQTQKNSPTILFASGVVGVVAASVLACRATLKLDDVLIESQKKQNADIWSKREEASIKLETAAEIAKLYAPAVIVGVIGIGCLGGSHHVLNKRNAALTAAYAGLERSFKEYRKIVRDEIGEDKERELHYKAQRQTSEGFLSDAAVVKKPLTPNDHSPYARFFDELNGNWQRTPEYNMFFLKCQQDYANDMLRARGHVLLNDVYDSLGIARSKAGAVVGWVISKDGGDNYIDFGIFDGKSEKVREFVNGYEHSILLDFNVDGLIYDKIG